MRYAFGSYVFDPERWTLSSHGVAMPMMQKTAALLAVLLENAGRLVSKAEILDAVWPDEDVIEANLAQHVFLIRQIFSAHSPGQSFIATHASRGYRFVAPVRTIVDEPDRSPAWREYARGLFYADRRTDASLERALHHFAPAKQSCAVSAQRSRALRSHRPDPQSNIVIVNQGRQKGKQNA